MTTHKSTAFCLKNCRRQKSKHLIWQFLATLAILSKLRLFWYHKPEKTKCFEGSLLLHIREANVFGQTQNRFKTRLAYVLMFHTFSILVKNCRRQNRKHAIWQFLAAIQNSNSSHNYRRLEICLASLWWCFVPNDVCVSETDDSGGVAYRELITLLACLSLPTPSSWLPYEPNGHLKCPWIVWKNRSPMFRYVYRL